MRRLGRLQPLPPDDIAADLRIEVVEEGALALDLSRFEAAAPDAHRPLVPLTAGDAGEQAVAARRAHDSRHAALAIHDDDSVDGDIGACSLPYGSDAF